MNKTQKGFTNWYYYILAFKFTSEVNTVFFDCIFILFNFNWNVSWPGFVFVSRLRSASYIVASYYLCWLGFQHLLN